MASQSKYIPRAIALLLLTTALLSGCAKGLDSDRIEAAIQQDIEERGGIPVKTVDCPKSVAIAVGETFQCLGVLSQGGDFSVTATQQDALGNVTWTIPNSKALLNVTDLETYFQTQIAAEIGSDPLINCGGVYRANKPGDQFECRVLNAIAPDQSQIEAIVVKIDPVGNLSWQQVRRQRVAASPTSDQASVLPNANGVIDPKAELANSSSQPLPDTETPAKGESQRQPALSNNSLD